MYFARKKSCWTDCVAPDDKQIEVVGTSYNGTIDRHFHNKKATSADSGVDTLEDEEQGNLNESLLDCLT